MCRKVIWLFYSLNLKKEEKVDFEREARKKIILDNLCCLEIINIIDDNFLIKNGLRKLFKKRVPSIIAFFECNDEIIQSHLYAIEKLNKDKKFEIYLIEKINIKNSIKIKKIEGLKNIPMLINA